VRISFPVFPGVRVSGGVPKGCSAVLLCALLLGIAVQHWHGLVQILTGVAVVGFLIWASKPRPGQTQKPKQKQNKHRA